MSVLNAVAAVMPNPDCRPCLDDAFFAIGGDSLNMVHVIEAVAGTAAAGYRIPVTAFTPACTLRDLVLQAQENNGNGEKTAAANGLLGDLRERGR